MGSVKAGWLILLSFLAGAEMWAQASSIPGKTASSTTPAQTADSVAESAARRLEAWEVDLPDNVPSLLDRIDWNETLVIGERQKAQGTYTYRLDGLLVGMEQWENGKRSEHFREQWNLGCSPDTSSSQAANCSLIRTRLMLWGLPTGGIVVRVNRYSTNERTLRLHRIDWNAGVFDFTLLEPDVPSTEVAARFSYDGDVMRLQSLRASTLSTSLFGDPPTAVEFRVSAYSSVLYAPFGMKGLKTGTQRGWATIIETLSERDRREWTRLVERKADFFERFGAQDSQRVLHDLYLATFGPTRAEVLLAGKTTATPDEVRRIGEAIDRQSLDEFRRWLTASAMSSDGQQRLIKYLSDTIER